MDHAANWLDHAANWRTALPGHFPGDNARASSLTDLVLISPVMVVLLFSDKYHVLIYMKIKYIAGR